VEECGKNAKMNIRIGKAGATVQGGGESIDN